jgi:hypothetical protein
MSRERTRKRLLPKYAGPVIEQGLAGLDNGTMTPGLYEITVRHDSWCDLMAGRGPCNCDPAVGPPVRVTPPQDN